MTREYVIVRSARRVDRAEADPRLSRARGAAATEPHANVEVADLSPGDLRSLARDDTVQVAAPVMPIALIRPFDADPPISATAGPAWGVTAVGADVSTFDGSDVKVSILDTGIDRAHPAFAGMTLDEKDFTGSGNGDRQGHGTHCAGTVFGRDVSGTRIGVARGVQHALIGKVLGDDGSGTSAALFNAMNWSLEQGARVISMSLGFDFPGMVAQLVARDWPADLAASAALEAYRSNLRVFDQIMGFAEARIPFDGGAVVVAAAGNESRRRVRPDYEIGVSIPAAASGVLSVAALSQGTGGFGIADFSNTHAEISGPGVGVVSAKAGGGLTALSGTSMATPHVAGVAALWWQAVRARAIPATSTNVIANLRASARTDGIAPGLDIVDRGVGMVAAPR